MKFPKDEKQLPWWKTGPGVAHCCTWVLFDLNK